MHTRHVFNDLLCSLLLPRSFTGGAGRDGVTRNTVVIGEDTHQAGSLVAHKGDHVVLGLDGAAGSGSFGRIQRLVREGGGAHLLHGIAVSVTQRADMYGTGLTQSIHAGQIGRVAADDLSQTNLVIAVEGKGLSAGIDFGGLGEVVQRGKLGILAVIGLSLNLVQFASKEDGSVLCAVEAAVLGQCLADIGVQQGVIVCNIVGSGIFHSLFLLLN